MIRALQTTDLEAVTSLWLAANLQAHAFIAPEYWEGNRNLMRELLVQAEVYVYENGEEIQGFAGMNGNYIEGIFVSPGMQSFGIGKALLDFLKMQKSALHLNVYQKNPRAIRFYAREGFQKQHDGLDEATGEKDYAMVWRQAAGEPEMRLSEYRSSDCAQMAELFYQTVHSINAKDYTKQQLDVWATGTVDLSAWDKSFRAHKTIVAVQNRELLGFGDMDATGYLDRLYIHKDCQGRGIATAICDALEHTSAGKTFSTHASVTAKPFFLRRGYQVIREQTVLRQGIPLLNYLMEKPNENRCNHRNKTKF